MEIVKNAPANQDDIKKLTNEIDFEIPVSYLQFMQESNGCEIYKDEIFLTFWPIEELLELNEEYAINEFADQFFILGSDGGNNAIVIEKRSTKFCLMPFIGMSNDSAEFIANSFEEFISLNWS
ncbi:MAG: SMI1/KNR4 family protein [bacterium]|nr:SMI1/KNR4 family protein [bacterium]